MDNTRQKSLREEHPSGWLYLTQHDAIPIIIDALLGLPPQHKFSRSELAEHAGVTRQIVDNHTALLIEVEIIEEVANTSPRQYQVADSTVVRELLELNSALNNVGSG